MSEKTEQPTEKKLRDGRKEGQVVKSIEITSLFQLIALYLYFHFFTEKMILILIESITFTLQLVNKPFSYALTQLSHGFNRVIGFCTAVSGRWGNSCYCG